MLTDRAMRALGDLDRRLPVLLAGAVEDTHAAPVAALVRCRTFLELFSRVCLARIGAASPDHEGLDGLVSEVAKVLKLPGDLRAELDEIRRLGNMAAHEAIGTSENVLRARKSLERLGELYAGGESSSGLSVRKSAYMREIPANTTPSLGGGARMRTSTQDKFPWGVQRAAKGWSVHRTRGSESVLFVIRNGRIEFPGTRVAQLPFSTITAVGEVNLQSIFFDVEVEDGAFSGEGLPIKADFRISVEARTDEASLRWIVSKKAACEQVMLSVVAEALQSTARSWNYEDMHFNREGFSEQIRSSIRNNVESETGYRLLSASVQVLSKDLEVARSVEATTIDTLKGKGREVSALESKRAQEQAMGRIGNEKQQRIEMLKNQLEEDELKLQFEISRTERQDKVDIARLKALKELSLSLNEFVALSLKKPSDLIALATSGDRRDEAVARLAGQVASAMSHNSGLTHGTEAILKTLSTHHLPELANLMREIGDTQTGADEPAG